MDGLGDRVRGLGETVEKAVENEVDILDLDSYIGTLTMRIEELERVQEVHGDKIEDNSVQIKSIKNKFEALEELIRNMTRAPSSPEFESVKIAFFFCRQLSNKNVRLRDFYFVACAILSKQ